MNIRGRGLRQFRKVVSIYKLLPVQTPKRGRDHVDTQERPMDSEHKPSEPEAQQRRV